MPPEEAPPPDELPEPPTVVLGTVSFGVEAWGVLPFGVETLGVETDGTVTFGVVTFGVVVVGEDFGADGVVTFGVVTVVVVFGTVIVGVVTIGVETVGVVTVGVATVVVVPGTLSAAAVAADTIARTIEAKSAAAIRLPCVIRPASYLAGGAPKPSEWPLGGVRGDDLRVLGAPACAAPPVDGKRVAEPLVQKRLEGGLGRQCLSHPAHEHDAARDQLLALLRRNVRRDAADRVPHVRLDVLDVPLCVGL
jgi:hypothetical protein